MERWFYKFRFMAKELSEGTAPQPHCEWIETEDDISSEDTWDGLVSQWCEANSLIYVPGTAVFLGDDERLIENG